jgi:hypothetical protein
LAQINLDKFDSNYEETFMKNKEIGEKLIGSLFTLNSSNDEISDYVVGELNKVFAN